MPQNLTCFAPQARGSNLLYSHNVMHEEGLSNTQTKGDCTRTQVLVPG